jgi:choline dehydrogenase
MNKKNGERMNVARCYLSEDVRKREGFELMADTTVLRVIVENGRATAIEARRRGHIWRLEAKLIVIASGAIGTPHLLLRSGLGPEQSVLDLGVPFVKAVPGVGERVLEHPGAAIFQRPTQRFVKRSDPLIQCVLRTGNLQIQAGSKVPFPDFTFRFVGIMCHVRKPKGVGRMVFKSADPEVGPRLDFDALEHPDDRRDVLAAMTLANRLTERPEMAQLAVPFFPRRKVRQNAPSFEAWLRKWCGIGYHPCGTVPMGTSVDQYGRVLGVDGLVVADASIMPTIPGSNINLPTIMIGERFGEWVRDGKFG